MKNLFYICFAFLFFTFSNGVFAQQQVVADPVETKVKALLAKMTLDEKIGQMNQYNGFYEATGPAPKDGSAKLKYDHLKSGLVGAVLNVRGVAEVRKLQEIAVKQTRLGIPLLFGSDVIHGYKTLSPIPLAEAASWDLQAIEQSARMAAEEASAVGVNWTFAPMVDITRDARWGRVMEGSGEDPHLGSLIAQARVRGFQGKSLADKTSIAACAKHFAAYGFAESGKDYNTVDIGTYTLYNTILPPFKAASDAGIATFMNSFNVINGVPSTANRFLQRDILKNAWGFKGFVVSDWGSGLEMIDHGFATDLKQVTELSANAGSDMDMESYAYISHLKTLVEEGKVAIRVIDDAVSRILRIKFELGLFENPYKYCDAKREKTELYSPSHIATALDMAKKSIVLLKNEQNLLPLAKSQKNIAVIGALAADKNSPLGNWRMGSDDNSATSVTEGLAAAGISYSYAKGADVITNEASFPAELQINTTDTTGFAAAVALAKNSEVVIMVLGEHGMQSGEGRSRSNLDLPGVQQQLLEAVYRVNKKIVLVVMSGRPLVLTWANTHIPAIVEAWQLGTTTGTALTQVLFGDYNPSGKLPMSFPRSVGQMPLYYNHFSTGRPGPKTEVFWSHYTDESNDALYPFGFGLSYTQFAYSNLQTSWTANGTIQASVQLTNSGTYAGEEVVQLYIRDKVASTVRPVLELKAFQKVFLQAGATKLVEFNLSKQDLGFYTPEGNFIVEPGEFELLLGGNSVSGLRTVFKLN
ncbi:MAG: beta-glucosidase BglX [Sphingobacteriaceae bacterium]|nr:beta-glucosidase BglX [Sphingobacteriaceae bacterium]